MYRTYKFRLYPNDNQKQLLNKSFGCGRFVYNYYLSKIKNDEYINAYSCIKYYTSKLKFEKTFLQEVDSIIIRKSLFSLENNLKRYYENNFGYPKFKSKYSKNSYTTSAVYGSYYNHKYCNIELDLDNKEIKLPKLKRIKIRGYRTLKNIFGKIINATISREANGKYYVSVLYEQEIINDKISNPTSIVGIDIGIKKLLTLSDGLTIDNNKYIEKYEKRIKRCQRELARKIKRSKNYYKCKKKLAILHSKLKNARKYYLHKITKKITDNYSIIVCEKLQTKNMIVKKELSKQITDASFSEILRQLEYKARFKGKYFYQIDSYYPSSQVCSVCNTKDSKYKNLNKRIYECSNCGNSLDRDYNSSVNIMFEGLKLFMKEKYSEI